MTNDKLKSDWKDMSINIDWGTIKAKHYGSGNNKVLALHGWQDNANTFDRIIPHLDNNLNLVAIDFPGHGWSDHFPLGFKYDLCSYIMIIRKVVQKLGWANFIFLGHSMGAVVGISYVAIFPDEVEAFISIDIIHPTCYDNEKMIRAYRKFFSQYLLSDQKRNEPLPEFDKKKLVVKMIRNAGSLDESSASHLLERDSKLSSTNENFVQLTRDPRIRSHFHGCTHQSFLRACAESIWGPILILHAENGYERHPSLYADMLDAYKKNCKLFRLEEIEGDHHIQLTNPSAVGPAICQFIRDVMLLRVSKL